MCIISKLKSTGGAADKKKKKKQNCLGCKFSQLPNHIKSIFHHFQSLCPQWNAVFFVSCLRQYMQQLTLEQERKHLGVWERDDSLDG